MLTKYSKKYYQLTIYAVTVDTITVGSKLALRTVPIANIVKQISSHDGFSFGPDPVIWIFVLITLGGLTCFLL